MLDRSKWRPFVLATVVILFSWWAIATSSVFKHCKYDSENQTTGESLQERVANVGETFWIYRTCIGEFLAEDSAAVIAFFTVVLAISTIFLWSSTRKAAVAAKLA